jgi:hypothetical protein
MTCAARSFSHPTRDVPACREYIGPVLVAAVIIVLAIRPSVGAMEERLLLRPEHVVMGTLAWGPVDYVIFYRLFMIIVAEVSCT